MGRSIKFQLNPPAAVPQENLHRTSVSAPATAREPEAVQVA